MKEFAQVFRYMSYDSFALINCYGKFIVLVVYFVLYLNTVVTKFWIPNVHVSMITTNVRVQSICVYLESAKLRALRALVPYVPRALRAPVPYVPRALRALVPHVPRALRAPVSCESRALVPYVPRALRALVPHVPYAPFALRVLCQTCSRVSRVLGALVPHVSCALLVLGLARTLRAFLLLVPHLLQVFQVNVSHVF